MTFPFLRLVGALVLFVGGCAGGPEIDTILEQAPKGSVHLERISDRGVTASHPIAVEQDIIARALRGVVVTEAATAIQSVFSKTSTSVRAFSEDDVNFLAPFLTQGLRQAAPDQRVGFVVRGFPQDLSSARARGAAVGSSEPPLAESTLIETTAGHLLVRDNWLHLTLTQFRKRAERPDSINMANRRLPDPSGKAEKILQFEPQEVLKPDTEKRSLLFGRAPETVFVIDYARLASIPKPGPSGSSAQAGGSSPAAPAGTPNSTGQDLKEIREEMKRKDAEIETLRKEMEDIRREMGKPGPKSP